MSHSGINVNCISWPMSSLKVKFSIFQPGPHPSNFPCASDQWGQQPPKVVQHWATAPQPAAAKQATMQSPGATTYRQWTSTKSACFSHWQAQIVTISVWQHYGKDHTETWNVFLYLSLDPVCLLPCLTKSRSRISVFLKSLVRDVEIS